MLSLPVYLKLFFISIMAALQHFIKLGHARLSGGKDLYWVTSSGEEILCIGREDFEVALFSLDVNKFYGAR